MKLLILTAFYPIPEGTHERMFVHVRDQYYQEHGADVTVLNFAADKDYEIDGIRVITLGNFEKSDIKYDIAVSHSANVRNHYRFLKKHSNEFEQFVFFFHGHEMLDFNKDYPLPYKYTSEAKFLRHSFQKIYDQFKIYLWTNYYRKLKDKSEFVFVSNWLFNHFQKNTGIKETELQGKYHIINNSVGKIFETESYNIEVEKKYDFITIRSNLDGSKYCVDLVMEYAKGNPNLKFLLIGKGKFFEYNEKPENVTWISATLAHEEMLKYINKSKCALMLTREDTQGVMTCEFATYGIPVITSDIDVCHEFFTSMPNVEMINNDLKDVDIVSISNRLWKNVPYKKDETYFAENTISKELHLYNKIY